jgi:hypothetical protein
MSDDISGYHAKYFIPTVRLVLDPLFAEYGFAYAGDHRAVTAYWVSGRLFFRVGYLPETKPNYELLMGIGKDENSPLEPKSSRNSVGLWRLLPPEIAPQMGDWRFDSPRTLEDELQRAWTEAVVPFATPVWSDEDRLARLIADHNDEITEEDERLMHDRLLKYARAEFDAGRFSQAIHAYDALDEDALTSADHKRMEIARRRM